ncbi:AAA family ATPase [Trichlorobacter thiogenes]|nr:ATP-binding protein [Trichlorobacter thiogenes]
MYEIEGFKNKVLPVASIYGANASGKTNILKALHFFVSGILSSHMRGSIEGGISRNAFKLDSKYSKEPSRFDCDFIHKSVRYHFGYIIDDEKIIEEWLYAYPHGTKQVWYYRKHGEAMYFGKFLKGKNRVIESMTRINSLFISVAAQNNNEKLLDLYKYFKNNFIFSFNQFKDNEMSYDLLANDKTKDIMIEFLKDADIGIVNSKFEEVKPPDEVYELDKKIRELVSNHSNFNMKSNVEKKQVKFAHRGAEGEEIYFDIRDESRGTQALVKMIGPILTCLAAGATLVIDEIDTSMHPHLCIKLIELFNNPEINRKYAQLLFTTHDTNLLSNKYLRRDEIWFTEKNLTGATELISLAEIKSRQNDNFEEGYLQGRYGGIPYLGSFKDQTLYKENYDE